MRIVKSKFLSCFLAFALFFTGAAAALPQVTVYAAEEETSFLSEIPAYSGEAYVAIDDNVPDLPLSDADNGSFETYSSLDALGRCGVAYANVGRDLMPTEERGSIGQVKPSGWHTVKYDCVDGKYLYNRCHLIGYQLTGENANEENLITGTRYLNTEGMLPFENMVVDYIKETGNHVLYRVTPVFEGDNLVASGVRMEAISVEDEGEGILFDVYCYNVQPGVTIDYATGESREGEALSGTSETYTATSNVNVRSGASTDSETLGQLAAGDAVEVESISGDWAKVMYNGTAAYVAAAYLTSGDTAWQTPDTEAVAQETKQDAGSSGSVVWIPQSGSKYHSNPGCSNMKNPSEVSESQAISMGYEPCKRCF